MAQAWQEVGSTTAHQGSYFHLHRRWRREMGPPTVRTGAQFRWCAVGDVVGWDLLSPASVHVVVVVADHSTVGSSVSALMLNTTLGSMHKHGRYWQMLPTGHKISCVLFRK